MSHYCLSRVIRYDHEPWVLQGPGFQRLRLQRGPRANVGPRDPGSFTFNPTVGIVKNYELQNMNLPKLF